MTETSLAQAEAFQDRSAWLKWFGIAEIAIAVLGLGMSAVMAVVPMAPEATSGRVAPTIFCALCGIALLVMGVGSLLRKNWARLFALIVSGFWLASGICSLLVVFFVGTRFLANSVPSPEPQGPVFAVILGMIAVAMVLPPAVLLFFYSRESVRATCLAGAPLPARRRKPTAIIIVAVWAALPVIVAIPVLLKKTSFTLFGIVLHGPMAVAMTVANIILSAWVVWAVWRLRTAGWWTALGQQLFLLASWAVTLAVWDMPSLLRAMGTPTPSVPGLEGAWQAFGVFSLILGAVFIAVILYAKRFFPTAGAAAE
jgi:hypothetical protein